ncbi:MAG TPA: ATP-binding protein, partial [Pseudomonadota bacterium]|nr:ATP-binding protein [Pseudomonadota bacterium]
MTTLSDALARAPNPLAAHTVSDGDGGTGWVDVPALHSEARAALLSGCERARHGHSQVFALVGEAGLGKSHLLLWLRQRLELRGDPLTYFIGMPALPDLAQPFRHALRQLVGALCRRESTVAAVAAEPSEPQSGLLDRPIDSLLWGALYTQTCDLLDAARVGMYQGPAALLKLLGPMCSDAGRRRPLADFAAAAQKVWGQVEPGLRSYLLSLPTEMSIDSAARAVLLQYPYADRRGLCTAWLAGEELSQKDRERLAAKQVINNENAAKYVLGSVVRLLTAPPGAHLVLHYDQTQQLVEQLGQPGLQAMAEVVAAIQSCGGSSLQVLALRPEHLTQLQGRAARPAVVAGPIKNLDQTVRLAPVGPELLREVVAARLAAGLAEADDRPSPLYPLTEAELGLSQWPKEADTPRAALQVFAKRYAERRRELVPGAGSAKNAVSTPDQKRSASGPARAKDAPSIPGTPERRSRSGQSPSLDFLSDEETSDALAATPVVTSPMQGVRARSLTHPDESGGTAATAKLVPQRASQGFVADSSPTIQALPKSLLVSATGKVQGREVKPASSFAADSSPTQRAVSDDVMGKVQGPGAASKR